jgi:undecaprenyl-diphosphatase
MDWIEALILGAIQGLTEFLPVSSSGHLEIAKYLFKDDITAQQSMFFTVLLHFATALSTVVYFRNDIWNLVKNLSNDYSYVGLIVLSMVPAVVVGLVFEELIETLFSNKIVFVACMLIVTAVLLLLADRPQPKTTKLSAKNAFVIGLAQAVAIIPGISRSGATISTAVLLNVERSEAAKFSFLMVIPLIFGKMAKDCLGGELALTQSVGYYAIGFSSAFIVGLLACAFMVAIVKKAKLKYFAMYCFAVGAVIIGLAGFYN